MPKEREPASRTVTRRLAEAIEASTGMPLTHPQYGYADASGYLFNRILQIQKELGPADPDDDRSPEERIIDAAVEEAQEASQKGIRLFRIGVNPHTAQLAKEILRKGNADSASNPQDL